MKHYAENLGSNVGAMIKVRQVVNFFCFLIIMIFLEPLKLCAVSRYLSYTIPYVNTVAQ